jgi:hypothetical protein
MSILTTSRPPVSSPSSASDSAAGEPHRIIDASPAAAHRAQGSRGYPYPVEIVGLGVDICEIERMERALERHPTMRERVFTPE